MYSARNIPELLELVDEAIFELEEMAFCMDEEMEDELADLVPHCRQMADYLKSLRQDIGNGTHRFAEKELEYVPLVRRLRQVLPFHALLEDINRIQLYGRLR